VTLTRLRKQASVVFTRAAEPLSRLPADFYTVLGFLGALAYLWPAWRDDPLLAAALLVVSGALDALDGAVARLRGEAGPRGGFLDSVLDRVADTVYALGFYMLGYTPSQVILFLGGSLITSYERARYEAAAKRSMEGTGLLERADRVAAQAVVLLVHKYIGLSVAIKLYWLLAALSWATVAHRLLVGYRSLPRTQ